MRSIPFLLSILLSGSLFARPSITSVNPPTAPSAGGTEITVIGSGFTPDAVVRFGSHPAETRFVNATSLIAVTPAHLPGPSFLEVSQPDGNDYEQGFTFTGEVPASFERLLLPILTNANGANGSLFRTVLTPMATVDATRVHLYGVAPPCHVTCIPIGDIDYPLELTQEYPSINVDNNGTPGRFLYVPKAQLDSVTFNLRVADVSRSSENYGTEIPVVRERSFRERRITFAAVPPAGGLFRHTLRIYSTAAMQMLVTIDDNEPKVVEMYGGAGLFDPAYGVFTDFPPGITPERITVEPAQHVISADLQAPFWAFISVTNNETQLITTITPQP